MKASKLLDSTESEMGIYCKMEQINAYFVILTVYINSIWDKAWLLMPIYYI